MQKNRAQNRKFNALDPGNTNPTISSELLKYSENVGGPRGQTNKVHSIKIVSAKGVKVV